VIAASQSNNSPVLGLAARATILPVRVVPSVAGAAAEPGPLARGVRFAQQNGADVIVVATPVYPWYALPLVVLVIMSRRWEWLAVWVAAYVAFVFDHSTGAQAAAYGGALLVVCLTIVRRARFEPVVSAGTFSSGRFGPTASASDRRRSRAG
jgi:hypothetical protein